MVTLKLMHLLTFSNGGNPRPRRDGMKNRTGASLQKAPISILNFYLLLFVNCVPWLCLILVTSSPSKAYTFNGSYKISPKPCTVEERTGTCMFVWECLKTEGKHLGMCVDGFMFGSCCGHNASSNFVLDHNSISFQSPSSSLMPSASALVSTSTVKTTSVPTTSTTSTTFHTSHESIFSTKFSTTTTRWPPIFTRATTARPITNTNPPMTTWTTTTRPTYSTTTTTERPLSSSTPVAAITSKPFTTSNSESDFSSSSVSPSNTVELKLPFVTSNVSSLPEEHKPFSSLSTLSQNVTPSGTGSGSTSSNLGPSFSFHTTGSLATTTSSSTSTSSTTASSTTTSTVTTPTTSTTRPSTNFNPHFSYGNNNKKTTQRPTTIFIDPASTTTPQPNISLDKHYGCGVSPMQPQMRIVGGKEASFARFPWQVSVRRTSFFGFSSTHRCGGALLNENWIATAGHCVDDLLTSQIRIRMGEWDFSATSEKYPHVERGVVKKVVHPSYNFFTYEHDLALIKLETPVILTPHINPICLPGNDDLLINENATVSGWGRLSEGGPLPSKLQYVTVPILSNAKCRDMFLKSGRVEHIPEIFLCAGYEGGGKDSCQGDSGGPLQVRGSDNRWFLAGIISWGIGCAEPNMPGVCTRISKFTSWILKHVTA